MRRTQGPPSLFTYAERAPSPAIAPWVLALWSFQADAVPPAADPYTVWPDGCASIVLAREAGGRMLLFLGPRITAIQPEVRVGRRFWGARLWPDAIAAVTGLAAREVRDAIGPPPAAIAHRLHGLDAALPEGDDVDRVLGAFDEFLVDRLRGAAPPDPRVRAAVSSIVAAGGEVSMRSVARTAGLGLRQLQRLFPDATGLTMREYARVRRLRAALAHRLAGRPVGWSRVAAETGFVDQAHLTREFRALTGLRPTRAARQLGRTTHDSVVP